MDTNNKKIVLELNEHDASQLLALIKRETHRVDKVWRPYWERQTKNIQQSIERAYRNHFDHPICFKDMRG